jgi:hypothetical protein
MWFFLLIRDLLREIGRPGGIQYNKNATSFASITDKYMLDGVSSQCF